MDGAWACSCGDDVNVPVVPCDDTAIQRAFDAVHDEFDLATGWEDDVRGLTDDELREVVLTVLRAAARA